MIDRERQLAIVCLRERVCTCESVRMWRAEETELDGERERQGNDGGECVGVLLCVSVYIYIYINIHVLICFNMVLC